jgi:hypothetical protein
MQLTPEQTTTILNQITADISQKVWDTIQHNLDDIACISVHRAAAILDISPQKLRRLFPEYVDLGERDTRFTLAQLRAAIAARTVKNAKANKRKHL